jgi:[NiFe] hydrogenase assembly HybE family chaperone
VAHYQQVWQAMHDMPSSIRALQVESLGFVRHEGDWLGVVVTPWFLNLFPLFGGGGFGMISRPESGATSICPAVECPRRRRPRPGAHAVLPLVAPVSTLADAAGPGRWRWTPCRPS